MKELTVAATLDNIPQVTAFVDEQLEALSCPMKAQIQIDVAIDELFSNIAKYAYDPGPGEATVRFSYEEAKGAVSVSFADRGMPFDPLQSADPDITLPAEERQIGGLGLLLVKKTMDAVEYRRENGQNVLTIQKRIS